MCVFESVCGFIVMYISIFVYSLIIKIVVNMKFFVINIFIVLKCKMYFNIFSFNIIIFCIKLFYYKIFVYVWVIGIRFIGLREISI